MENRKHSCHLRELKTRAADDHRYCRQSDLDEEARHANFSSNSGVGIVLDYYMECHCGQSTKFSVDVVQPAVFHSLRSCSIHDLFVHHAGAYITIIGAGWVVTPPLFGEINSTTRSLQ